MKKTYTHILARTALATIAALGGHNAMAAELQIVAGDTATIATLALADDASAVSYDDDTFAAKSSAAAAGTLGILSVGTITGAHTLTLDNTKLALTGAALNEANLNFAIVVHADDLPAQYAAYGNARWATSAAMQTWLADYLSSTNTTTAIGNITINTENLADLVTIHGPINAAILTSKFTHTNFTGSAKAFDMVADDSATSELLGNETSFSSGNVTLTADATIDLKGFDLSDGTNEINGAFSLTITDTDGTGGGIFTLANTDLGNNSTAGSYITGLTVDGKAIVNISDAQNFSTKAIPVTVSGADAKLRCSVATTFGTLTLG